MQLPVLLEQIANNGFRAKSGEPLLRCAEGATRDEAVGKLRTLMDQQLQNGAQLIGLDLPTRENPWLAMAGIYDPNDPLVQEWKDEMAAYRNEVENDPDYP